MEELWLQEVKSLRAYFIGLNKGGGFSATSDENYLDACKQLNKILINPNIKASKVEFGKVKHYLEEHYLINNKINIASNFVSGKLISRKAKRIYERIGEESDMKGWASAETFVRMFYENIIPAVMEKDRERTLSVLKAFWGDSNRNKFSIIVVSSIVNCFEAALAIYFLDPDIIRSLCAKEVLVF